MTIQKLQDRIKKYDAEYYFPSESETFRLRHALGHLNKTLGLIATYLDDIDHGREPAKEEMTDKVIPDLMQYSLRLANMFDLDLEKQFIHRQDLIEESKKK